MTAVEQQASGNFDKAASYFDGAGKIAAGVMAVGLLGGLIWTFGFLMTVPGQAVSFDATQLASIAPMIAASGILTVFTFGYAFGVAGIPFMIPRGPSDDRSKTKSVVLFFILLFTYSSLIIGVVGLLHAANSQFSVNAFTLLFAPALAIATSFLWNYVGTDVWLRDISWRECLSGIFWFFSILITDQVAGQIARDKGVTNALDLYGTIVALMAVGAFLSAVAATTHVRGIVAGLGFLVITLMFLDAPYMLSMPFRLTGYAFKSVAYYVPKEDSGRLQNLARSCTTGIRWSDEAHYTFKLVVIMGDQLLVDCSNSSAIQIRRGDKWSRIFEGTWRASLLRGALSPVR